MQVESQELPVTGAFLGITKDNFATCAAQEAGAASPLYTSTVAFEQAAKKGGLSKEPSILSELVTSSYQAG